MLTGRFLIAAVVILIAGCAQLPKQAFNKEAAKGIKTVVIAQPEDQDSYEAAVLGHPAAGFGLIGGLVAAADIQMKSSRLTSAIDAKETRLQERFVKKLRENILNAGYETSVITMASSNTEDQMMGLLKQTNADAALIVKIVGRYLAAGPSTDYIPSLFVTVKKVNLKSSDILYQDAFSYGYTTPQMKSVHFASDSIYRFSNIDTLTSDPAKTRQGLLQGIDAIAAQIAADLKR